MNFLKNLIPHSPDKFWFVVTNIFVAFVGMIRSFLLMRYFNYYDLGVITIMQTLIMLVSFVQLGLLNGGYRIISIGLSVDFDEINNTIWTAILSLLFVSMLIGSLCWNVGIIKNDKIVIVLIGVVVGFISLLTNWIKNIFVARILLKNLNKINFLTSIFGLLFLFTIPLIGFVGAILAIIIIPISFLALSIINNKFLIPRSLSISLKTLKWILTFGFLPFIAGILFSFNLQIERWGVTYFLGLENLGKFYLVYLFTTLFMLIPGSLDNLFFPPMIQFYHKRDFGKYKNMLIKYYGILVLYSLLVILVTVFFMEPIIEVFFPQHIVGINFVYIIIPGLFFVSLSNPIGLLFNSAIILKPMVWVSLISIIINIIFLLVMNLLNAYNLYAVAGINAIVGMSFFVSYLLFYKKYKKRFFQKDFA